MKIITGMHRSGTSMIAGALYEMGADFGDDDLLLAADQWNKRGYFENREVFLLNDAILLGRYAPSTKFWTTPPEERSLGLRLIMTVARVRYLLLAINAGGIGKRAESCRAVIKNLAEKYDDIIVKDPRFSLVIGHWARITNVEKVLFCFRHPYEVADSLRRRGRSPLWLGYWQWHAHVAAFLEQAHGIPCVVVSYNNFFNQDTWLSEAKRLYNFLERPFDEAEATALLGKSLDRKLKSSSFEGGQLPGYIEKLYTRLWEYHGKHEDLVSL